MAMRQDIVASFCAFVLCAFAVLSGDAAARQAKTGLHDDTAGTIRDLTLRKEKLAFANSSASITFDVDYVYKSSTLMGEPILLCGARLTNPRGTVSFDFRGERHQIRVTPNDAELIDPHHVDLIVRYFPLSAQNFYARCSTGIPGTEKRDPHNLATSPSWGEFLCVQSSKVLDLAHGSLLPDMLDHKWCAKSDYLNEEKAKALFEGRELRATAFFVGSLSLNIADLVLREIKQLQAARLADRLATQLDKALHDSKPGFLSGREAREGWQELSRWVESRVGDANRHTDSRERARATRDAIRHLLAAEHSSDVPTARLRAVQEALAENMAAQRERDFFEDERRHLAALEDGRRRAAGEAAARLGAARAAIAAAPEFRFAKDEADVSSLLLLIDVSGSMNTNNRIGAAKRAAKEAIRRAAANNRSEFGVFSFTGSCESPDIRSIPFGRDVAAAERFIDSLKAGGGTPLTPSVRAVNRYMAANKHKSSRAQLIILLADGDDSCGGLDAEVETLRRQGFLFRHETIGLEVSGSGAERTLRSLATQSGGSYHDAASTDQVVQAFENAIMSTQILDLLGRFGARGGNAANSPGRSVGGDLNIDILKGVILP